MGKEENLDKLASYLQKKFIFKDNKEEFRKTSAFISAKNLDENEFYKKVPVGVDSLIKASKKLMAINRGETDPDERDSFIYRRVYDVDDLISERTRLDAGKIRNNIMYKLSKVKNLKHFPNGVFDSYALGHIIGSPLSLPSEEVNPLFNKDQQTRMTVFGMGGINSTESITDEAQNVHPSQFGFVDVIAGPECFACNSDYQVLTYNGFKNYLQISLNDLIACNVNNNIEYKNPEKIIYEDYEGRIYKIKNDILNIQVTPNHRFFVSNSTDMNFSIEIMHDLYGKDFYFKSLYDGCYIPVKSEQQTYTNYKGKVWCLKVPGDGLFYIKNGKDGHPFCTGNSEKLGVDMRLAYNTRIHKKSGKLMTQVRNRKTGKIYWMTPDEIKDSTIAFPD